MGDQPSKSQSDAPKPTDSSSKSGDRIESAERNRMVADADAGARDARGDKSVEPSKDKNIDGSRPRDARPISEEQKAEREAVTALPNRVGFHFDSAKVNQGELQRVLGNMTPEQRASLKDPSATVILTGSASRVGHSKYNMELSKHRAENVAAQLKELGVTAQIQIFAYGEEQAKDRGQPDGIDDRDARSVNIDVLRGKPTDVVEDTKLTDDQIGDLADKWTDQVPDLSKVDTVKELGDRGLDVAKGVGDITKDVISGNEGKAIAKAVKAAGELIAENQAHKEYRENVSLNLIPSYIQEFDRKILGPDQVQSKTPEVIEHPGAYRNAESKAAAMKAVRDGALLFQKGFETKTPTEINEMRQAARDMNNLRRLHRQIEKALHHKLNH